jgi:proteasome accessory factor C
VRLRYFVPSRDEESERVVDPHRVVRAQGSQAPGGQTAAYLDAWCHRARAPRLFRLDRITDAEVLDSPVATDPAPRDLEAGVLAEDETVVATLRLAPQARWVVDYYPVLDVRPSGAQAGEEHVEVDLRVADERWLTRLLLRLAPYAEVVRPREFADSFTATAQSALRLYDEPDVD